MNINTKILSGAMPHGLPRNKQKCDSCKKVRITFEHTVHVSVWLDDRPEHRIVDLPIGRLCKECADKKNKEAMDAR